MEMIPPSDKKRFNLPTLEDFQGISKSYPVENDTFYTLMRANRSSASLLVALANHLEKQIKHFEKPITRSRIPQLELRFDENNHAASKPKNRKRPEPDRMQLSIDFSANHTDDLTKPYTRKDAEQTLETYCKPHSGDTADMLLRRRELTGTIRSFRHILGTSKKFCPSLPDVYTYPDMKEIILNGAGGETVSMRLDQISRDRPWLGNVMTDWIHSSYEGQKAKAKHISDKYIRSEMIENGGSYTTPVQQSKKVAVKPKVTVKIPPKNKQVYRPANGTYSQTTTPKKQTKQVYRQPKKPNSPHL